MIDRWILTSVPVDGLPVVYDVTSGVEAVLAACTSYDTSFDERCAEVAAEKNLSVDSDDVHDEALERWEAKYGRAQCEEDGMAACRYFAEELGKQGHVGRRVP